MNFKLSLSQRFNKARVQNVRSEGTWETSRQGKSLTAADMNDPDNCLGENGDDASVNGQKDRPFQSGKLSDEDDDAPSTSQAAAHRLSRRLSRQMNGHGETKTMPSASCRYSLRASNTSSSTLEKSMANGNESDDFQLLGEARDGVTPARQTTRKRSAAQVKTGSTLEEYQNEPNDEKDDETEEPPPKRRGRSVRKLSAVPSEIHMTSEREDELEAPKGRNTKKARQLSEEKGDQATQVRQKTRRSSAAHVKPTNVLEEHQSEQDDEIEELPLKRRGRNARKSSAVPSEMHMTSDREDDEFEAPKGRNNRKARQLSEERGDQATQVRQKARRRSAPQVKPKNAFDQAQNEDNDNEGEVNSRPAKRRGGADITKPFMPMARFSAVRSQCNGGKIRWMHLTNFMCHANLRIEFNPRMNFIIGSNGSGKSAILAALVLGLGGTAKSTNRSGNFKQLIRSGEQSAKIEIALTNVGPDAYEPEVYGDTITIVRTISQCASRYSLKAVSGKTISNKLCDLQRILLYLNIQADNPVFVLNQDSAREFLRSGDPKTNYRLFVKATQIDLMWTKNEDCREILQNLNEQWSEMKQELEEKKKDYNEAEAKLAKLHSIKRLREILKKKLCELSWLNVKEKEKEIEDITKLIRVADEKRTKCEQSTSQKREFEQEHKNKIREIELQKRTKSNEHREHSQKEHDLKEQLKRTKDDLFKINSYMEGIRKRITSKEQNIEELRKGIEERTNNASETEQLQKRREEDVAKIQNEIDNNTASLETATRDLDMFYKSKAHLDQEIRNLQEEQSKESSMINRYSHAVAMAERSKAKDNLSIYGENMTQFVNDITRLHKQGKFTEMPLGPLGRYVEVPNNKYRDVVEKQLSPLINAFVVNDKRDNIILKNLLKRYPNFTPTIIIWRYQSKPFNVSRGKVPPIGGTSLLLDLIQCTDVRVLNLLIDRLSIETILITDQKKKAEQITAHEENVPQNLQKVVLLNPSMEYYPAPQYRMYQIKVNKARFLQVDMKEYIAQLKSNIIEAQQRLERINQEISNKLSQVQNQEKLIRGKRATAQEIKNRISELKEQIDELQNYEAPRQGEIKLLQQELQQNEENIKDYRKVLQEKEQQQQDIQEKCQSIESELQGVRTEMSKIEEGLNDLNKQIEKEHNELRLLERKCVSDKDVLSTALQALKELDQNKAQKERELNKAMAAALAKGERIDTQATAETLNEEIDVLKVKVREKDSITETPEQLEKIINESGRVLEKESRSLNKTKQAVLDMHKSLDTRVRVYDKLSSIMSMMSNWMFQNLLNLKNFEGEILIDQKEETLDLSVIPRRIANTSQENTVSNTKSLSGGERSYTTVALLISLWASVDHPFFFLDEYDVFTDEVNRETLTRLLTWAGRNRPDRQFTFLTPQDMSLTASDEIAIFKMPDHNRR